MKFCLLVFIQNGLNSDDDDDDRSETAVFGYLQSANLAKEQQKSTSAQLELSQLQAELATLLKEHEKSASAQDEVSKLKEELSALTKAHKLHFANGLEEATKLKE